MMFDEDSYASWLIASLFSMLLFLLTLWMAVDSFKQADAQGYVLVKTRFSRTKYPAHFFLLCPTVSLLITIGCAYKAWKLYQGEE